MNQKIIKVGVSEFSPLVIKKDDRYFGFEIELWEKVAKDLGLEFSYSEYKFKDLLSALSKKKIDVAIAGITMTAEREIDADFSHDTFNSGLQILIQDKSKFNIFAILKSVFNKDMWIILLVTMFFVVLSAHAVWIAERFSGSNLDNTYFPGVFNAIWWVIVTITTVGYGDYTPTTYIGRIIGIITIMMGVGIIGLYIARVSSVHTLQTLNSDISSYRDLKNKKVATKRGSTSEKFLKELGAIVVSFEKIEEAYIKLKQNKVEAVVFDSPTILYYANNEGRGKVKTVGEIFDKQNYGFGIQRGSQHFESINLSLLKVYDSGQYDVLYKKWFGKSR